MSRFKDLTGLRFGRLLVVKKYGKNNSNNWLWYCLCDCGETAIVSGSNLGKTTFSCGCFRKEASTARAKKATEGNTLEFGESSFNVLYKMYVNNALKRGYAFNLSHDQFRELTILNCYYCGTSPNTVMKYKRANGHYIYNGIDRVDNTKGYTIDNVVTCCKWCNRAKGIMTGQEFKDWVYRVYHHYAGKED